MSVVIHFMRYEVWIAISFRRQTPIGVGIEKVLTNAKSFGLTVEIGA